MAFKIIKRGSNDFWHNNGFKEVNLSDWEIILEAIGNTVVLEAKNGANFPQKAVGILDVIVIDETASGLEETFTNVEDLRLRLVALGYTPYLDDSGLTQNIKDALNGANNPSSSNVFATMADVAAGSTPSLEEVLTEGNTATDKSIVLQSGSLEKYTEFSSNGLNYNDGDNGINIIVGNDGVGVSDGTKSLQQLSDRIVHADGTGEYRIKFDPNSNLGGDIFVKDPLGTDQRLAFVSDIPTDLAQLGEDATHRVVTDAEKASWNAVIGGSVFQTVWNATTNSPTLASGTGTKGYYYIVSIAGSTNLDGITDWKVGDWAIFDGTVWRKVDNTDAVSSVNGLTGAVLLDSSNVPDTSNKRYVTDADITKLGNTSGTNSGDNATNSQYSGLQAQIDARVKILFKDQIASTAVTGTTSETQASVYFIPANTFSATDIMRIPEIIFEKTGTAGTATYKIKVNTTNNFGTSTTIATWTPSATTLYNKMTRSFTLRGGNIRGFNFGNNAQTDMAVSAAAISSIALSTSVDIYIYVSVQLANSADSVIQSSFYMTN